jgi:hypothetical protein
MKNRILASSELQVVYARERASAEEGSEKGSGALARDLPPDNAARGGLGNRGGTN